MLLFFSQECLIVAVDAYLFAYLFFWLCTAELMRRTARFLFNSFERGWKNKTIFPFDRRGRFNLDEAAAELQLDEEYVASLYKPLHYTYSMKGQRYPAEQGRTSRPGSLSSSRDRLFPLYRRNYKLDREMRVLDYHRVRTE